MANQLKNKTMLVVLLSFIFSACAGNTWEENHKAIIGGAGGATAGVLGGIIVGG